MILQMVFGIVFLQTLIERNILGILAQAEAFMTSKELNELHYKVKSCEENELEYIESKLEREESALLSAQSWGSDQERVLKITDSEGKLIAGIVAVIHSWGTAELDLLWVDERYRRKGMASALIREAEAFFRENGCKLAIVDTFDFQARSLYEKHGYSLYGTVEDFPKGHCKCYLKKRLDPFSGECASSNAPGGIGFEILPGDEQDIDAIFYGSTEYDKSQVRIPFEMEVEDGFFHINRILVDRDGKIIAGCYSGITGWGNLFFEIWVDEQFRNRGIGSYLLCELEREAKLNGAYIALLNNVYDRQEPFLRKNGYRTSIIFEGGPQGRRVMKKEL